MRFSFNWLKTWVDIPWSPEVTAEKLTSLGFLVEKINQTGVQISHIVAGKILEIEKHPNADRLQVAKVNDGKEVRTIVCGASNIAVGQIIPVAKPGTKFPNGLEIVVSEIRGVESQGMLCSERELGLSDSHAGIMMLPESSVLGKEVKEILVSDVTFDIDVPPNRPDVLSHLGLAREIAALTGKKLKPIRHSGESRNPGRKLFSKQHVKHWIPAFAGMTKVSIKEPKLCHRYMGNVFFDVKVGPSPDWMVKRLSACGIRSINNIVDITNYVLLEWGHPLHAFDLDKLAGRQIVVRKAEPQEKILALDEKTYTLEKNDLVIADEKNPVAIAGVMGGQLSGVTENTKNILLESAVFDRVSVRNTSKRLMLKSESSLRFEKGTDAITAELASLSASSLIMTLAQGKPGQASDVYPTKLKVKKVSLQSKDIARIVGVDIPDAKSEKILKSLEFGLKKKKGAWEVQVPAHRKDIDGDMDLIEEIVRIVGYNIIEPRASKIASGNFPPSQTTNETGLLSEQLKGLGLTESLTSTFYSKEWANKFGVADEQLVQLANPLAQDESVLRPLLVPSLIKAVQTNINHQRNAVHLFEMGKQFTKTSANAQPTEEKVLALVSYGDARTQQWQEKVKEMDLYYLKGMIDQLNSSFKLELTYSYTQPKAFLHPHQSFELKWRNSLVGYAGVLHPGLAQELDLKLPCVVAEMNLSMFTRPKQTFAEFSKHPFVERDLAILVSKATSWTQILETVNRSGGELLKSVIPFDLFSGPGIDPALKSIAFRLRLQQAERTLSETEINTVMDKIKSSLQSHCGAQLR